MFRKNYYKIKLNKREVCFVSKVVSSGLYWKKPVCTRVLFHAVSFPVENVWKKKKKRPVDTIYSL